MWSVGDVMRLCGRSACFEILRKRVYTILGILKGNLGLKTWAVMRNLLVICLDHYFQFVQLPKLQFVWAMLHLTSLWTDSWDIRVLLECDWFFSVIQPPKVALYMGMLLWSDFIGPISESCGQILWLLILSQQLWPVGSLRQN